MEKKYGYLSSMAMAMAGLAMVYEATDEYPTYDAPKSQPIPTDDNAHLRKAVQKRERKAQKLQKNFT